VGRIQYQNGEDTILKWGEYNTKMDFKTIRA
jgi:hypothetical protein